MPEMHHPDLPGRTITVHDRAVKIHQRSGWLLGVQFDVVAKDSASSAFQRVRAATAAAAKPSTELPAGPVETEQASDPLNLTEGD